MCSSDLEVGFYLHQEGPNLGKTSCPLPPVTIRLRHTVWDPCRSNGPRVGQPKPHNLSRHWGRLRPSRPQGEEPPPGESTARRPTARSRPSPRDDFQRSRLWGVGRRLQQTMTSSKGTGQGRGYNEAHSPPLTKGRHGYSAPYLGRSPCGVALLPNWP